MYLALALIPGVLYFTFRYFPLVVATPNGHPAATTSGKKGDLGEAKPPQTPPLNWFPKSVDSQRWRRLTTRIWLGGQV